MNNTQVAIDAVKQLFKADEEIALLKEQRDELLEVIGKMIGDLHERAYHELMTDPKHYAASALKQLIAKAKGEK